jgi:peptidoglycan/xylan/chitin deacetylase (PgdA/CDA1 family)
MVRKMIRDMAKRLPFASKAASIARHAYRRLTAPRPVILMYHRVAEESFDPWNLAVSPANFTDQMRWVARRRAVLPLTEFAQRQRDGTIPSDAIAITFDDGYACNAATAALLLNELGLAATIFLPAELIQRGCVFWWDELQGIVIDHPRPEIQVGGEAVSLGERQEGDHRWPSHPERLTPRQRAFYDIWSRIQPLPKQELEEQLAQLRAQAPSREPSEAHRLMTPAEARSICSDLVEFGSHSMSHSSLPGLSAKEKAREICESIDACEAITGVRPRTFAYPFGEFDPECQLLIEQSDFLCACTAQRRAVWPTDRLSALPRIQVGDCTARELESALRVL